MSPPVNSVGILGGGLMGAGITEISRAARRPELGGVEQLLAAAERQHPGLMQQRVDGRVTAQHRGRLVVLLPELPVLLVPSL